jgi:hypothetical protein
MNEASKAVSLPEDSSEPDRYVFCERPRCPICECTDLQTLRSQKNGDGTITQRKRCRSCDHRFSVVWE